MLKNVRELVHILICKIMGVKCGFNKINVVLINK